MNEGLYQNIRQIFFSRIRFQNPPPNPLQRGKSSVQFEKSELLMVDFFKTGLLIQSHRDVIISSNE